MQLQQQLDLFNSRLYWPINFQIQLQAAALKHFEEQQKEFRFLRQ